MKVEFPTPVPAIQHRHAPIDIAGRSLQDWVGKAFADAASLPAKAKGHAA
jgi:hypothetical protein